MRLGVFGLKREIAPVVAEARETLADARIVLAVVVALGALGLLVSLLTLAAVEDLADRRA
jgi:hypothetical protein